jgi:hypothetical protein
VANRHDAIHRRDIFDKVWTDVVVSDSALSQAIRTLRRTLGDDSREPRFIRTVSRHGYQFIAVDVVEGDEDDDTGVRPPAESTSPPGDDPFEPLLQRLLRTAETPDEEADQRDAAERLHALGTAEALRRLDGRRHHEHARALLRDARWDVPGAEAVPLFGEPGAVRTVVDLVALRLRAAMRLAVGRGASAAIGGALAGVIGGLAGGGLLAFVDASDAPASVAIVLALVGAVAGAFAACGVGGGMALGESAARSQRLVGIVTGGAGCAVVGGVAQWMVTTCSPSWSACMRPWAAGQRGCASAGPRAGLRARDRAGRWCGTGGARGGARIAAAMLTATTLIATLVLSALGRPLVGGTLPSSPRRRPAHRSC